MKKRILLINVSFVVFISIILILTMYLYSRGCNNIYCINSNNKEDKIVFLGDSITEQYRVDEFYYGLPVINSGKGGYTTEDVYRHLKKSVYKYNPSKVFLLIGINDLKKQTKRNVIYNNIIDIVDSIKENCPNTKIYIESIYPTNNSDNPKISSESVSNRSNEDIDYINRKLKKYCDHSDTTYIDINKELKDDEGLLKLDYTVEGTHITTLGYVRVTRTLIPYIG